MLYAGSGLSFEALRREPFKNAFGPHCFYCGTHLPTNNPLDHVLPWSLVGIDGLANLVLACTRCIGDKSGALPALTIVDRVLKRERNALEEIASELQWPTRHDRVVAAGGGVYRGQHQGVPSAIANSPMYQFETFHSDGLDSHQRRAKHLGGVLTIHNDNLVLRPDSFNRPIVAT